MWENVKVAIDGVVDKLWKEYKPEKEPNGNLSKSELAKFLNEALNHIAGQEEDSWIEDFTKDEIDKAFDEFDHSKNGEGISKEDMAKFIAKTAGFQELWGKAWLFL